MYFRKNKLSHTPIRVGEIDTEKGNHESTKESNSETVPLHNGFQENKDSLSPSNAYFRLWGYANAFDWILRTIAAFGALGGGTAYPLMTLIFGSLVNDFNGVATGAISPSKFRSNVNHNALWFVYLFIGKFGVSHSVPLVKSLKS
jgi:hypothetical protein